MPMTTLLACTRPGPAALVSTLAWDHTKWLVAKDEDGQLRLAHSFFRYCGYDTAPEGLAGFCRVHL